VHLHPNARLTPAARLLLVQRVRDQRWSVSDAATAAGVSVRTGYKWLARYRHDGIDGLSDRSSRPSCSPTRVDDDRVEAILKLRRIWFTAAEIAEVLGMALSTISLVLKRHGLGRRSALIPKEQQRRYERACPGDLLHIDIKKLAKIDGGVGHRIHGDRAFQVRRGHRARPAIGYEFVHVAIDDATRLAYAEVLPDERARTAVGFLLRALRYFRSMGITVRRVMTDNGSAYISHLHTGLLTILGIRHLRTRPYRPQTNGKAERFIRTMLNGWAYAGVYTSSSDRNRALPGWLEHYNHRRPHGSLSRQPPATRLNNLLGSYS
jgi:transposase InsO family protein/transposase-like protein